MNSLTISFVVLFVIYSIRGEEVCCPCRSFEEDSDSEPECCECSSEDFTVGEEIAGKFQGDMILADDQLSDIQSGRRIGTSDKSYLWPKDENTGTVTVKYDFMYEDEFGEKPLRGIQLRFLKFVIPLNFLFFSSNLTDDEQKGKIRRALDRIEKVSCIKFVQEPGGIQITDKGACFSYVGNHRKEQIMSLSRKYCFSMPGTILHEFMHALGFSTCTLPSIESFISKSIPKISKTSIWINLT